LQKFEAVVQVLPTRAHFDKQNAAQLEKMELFETKIDYFEEQMDQNVKIVARYDEIIS
jgi:hypothetical protein